MDEHEVKLEADEIRALLRLMRETEEDHPDAELLNSAWDKLEAPLEVAEEEA